jgi:hypothetical protein
MVTLANAKIGSLRLSKYVGSKAFCDFGFGRGFFLFSRMDGENKFNAGGSRPMTWRCRDARMVSAVGTPTIGGKRFKSG